MLSVFVVLLALAASAVVVVFHGVAIWLAAKMPRLDPSPPDPATSAPSLSVIIAARNEELELPGCLDGLLAQDAPPSEILVVDGGSTDRSREVARARAPRVTLIDEPPLPPGWVGKNWACHVGYRASRGEYLLFTDADMRYHPSVVGATLRWAEREHADLATLAPRIEAVGFWEKVVLPFYTQVVLTYFRTPRVNVDASSAAMANGQFLLVHRAAYEHVGGHEAIRGAVLEDVRLAREFRRSHLRMRVAWAPELLETRMYRDRREMFEGILKNIHGTEYSTARQVVFLAALVGFFWLPLALLPFGLWSGSAVLAGVGAFLWVALFGKHVGFASGVRHRWYYGLLYPLAVGFYTALVVESIRAGRARRPIVWKGRAYPREGDATTPRAGNS